MSISDHSNVEYLVLTVNEFALLLFHAFDMSLPLLFSVQPQMTALVAITRICWVSVSMAVCRLVAAKVASARRSTKGPCVRHLSKRQVGL